MDRYTAIVSRFSITQRLAILAGVAAVVVSLAAPAAYGRDGVVGVQAIAIAAGVSLAGAAAAVVLVARHQGTPSAVSWILAGDLVAMGLPLAVGAIVSRQKGPLAEAGLFGWVVVFFLAMLMTKTILVAPLAQQAKHSAVTTKVGA